VEYEDWRAVLHWENREEQVRIRPKGCYQASGPISVKPGTSVSLWPAGRPQAD